MAKRRNDRSVEGEDHFQNKQTEKPTCAARGHAPAVFFRQGVRVYDRVWSVKRGERKRRHVTGRDICDVCFPLVGLRDRCSTSGVSRLSCLGFSFQRRNIVGGVRNAVASRAGRCPKSRSSDSPGARCVRGELAGRIRVEIGCGIFRKTLGSFCGFAGRCLVAFFRGWDQVRKKGWSVGRNGLGYGFLAEHGRTPWNPGQHGVACGRCSLSGCGHAVWARRRRKKRFGEVPQY